MPVRVIALDLERTLVSDAMQREPRPGLRDFLLFCCQRFQRVALFTSVNKDNALAVSREFLESGDVPRELMEKVEYVEWHGMYKDLRYIPGAVPSEILLMDDDEGWV